MRSNRGRALAASAVVALGVAVLAGCGDDSDEPSASEQVCAARGDLDAAIQSVVDAVQAGNFGTARDELDGVRDAAAALSDAVDELSSEQRGELSASVDQLRSDIDELGSVSSLDDLSERFDLIRTAASDAGTSIREDLNCG